jgi:hypothetical protein
VFLVLHLDPLPSPAAVIGSCIIRRRQCMFSPLHCIYIVNSRKLLDFLLLPTSVDPYCSTVLGSSGDGWWRWKSRRGDSGVVASSSARGGRLGQSDAQDGWNLRVADLGENPRFRPLAGAGDADVLYVLEGIIEVKPLAPSANLRRKPQIHGSDDGGASTSFPSWGHQSWRCLMVCRCPPSWKLQEEGIMSTGASLPSV